MNVLRIIVGVLAAVMAAGIAWAWNEGHFLQELEVMTVIPWGIVTLMDLYVTFFLVALVMWFTERTWWQAAFWIALLPFLGGLWAAIWFAWRLPFIADRLSRPDWPKSPS